MKKHTYLRLFFLSAALFCMAMPQFSFFSGSKFIFSSHMFGHVILLLIAAPFSVLAMRERPESMGGLAFGLSRFLSAMPWVNWVLGVAILWVWQVPSILNALMTWDSPGFHRHLHLLSFLHSGSLLLAGILFCWPLAGPYLSHRLSAPESLLYLTTAWVAVTLLGVLIAFASPGLYGGTAIPVSHRDQLFSAFILWVPACIVYLTSGIFLLREWMGGELWIHHEFYRRNKRRRIKVAAPEQEQVPAGAGEFVPRGGAIVPHHSAQQI